MSVLSTAYAKLQSIAQDCFGRIDGYSRFIARNPGKDNFFEALLLLPAILWPESVRSSLRTLSQSAQDPGDGRVVKLKDLLSLFPNATPPTKSKYSTFCRALGALGLGIEPDVRFGGALPFPDDPVAAFPAESIETTSDRYGVAALLLLLASVVASADGDFSEPEAQHLRRQIKEKMDLPDHEQRRLLARMAAYRVKAPSTSGLKQTIEGMNAATRTGVIDFLITLVCADGVVAPTEVKAMERIYSLFGMDVASLYAKLHSLTADPGGVEPTTGQKSGVIQLDKAKIERLKAVSAVGLDTKQLTPSKQPAAIALSWIGSSSTIPCASQLWITIAGKRLPRTLLTLGLSGIVKRKPPLVCHASIWISKCTPRRS